MSLRVQSPFFRGLLLIDFYYIFALKVPTTKIIQHVVSNLRSLDEQQVAYPVLQPPVLSEFREAFYFIIPLDIYQ